MTWANQRLTRVRLWLVVKVPRGPVVGCHVAPRDWLLVCCVKFGMASGVEPTTSRQGMDWQNGLATWAVVVLVTYTCKFVLCLVKGFRREKGRGLAPALGTYRYTYDRASANGSTGKCG
jgi:hypothetical protein